MSLDSVDTVNGAWGEAETRCIVWLGFFFFWFALVCFILFWFYGISTSVSYLMPNPLYTYILNIYDL